MSRAAEHKESSGLGCLLVHIDGRVDVILLTAEEPQEVPGIEGTVTSRVKDNTLLLTQQLGMKRELPSQQALAALNKKIKELTFALAHSKKELEASLDAPSEEQDLSRYGAMLVEQKRIEKELTKAKGTTLLQYDAVRTTQTFTLQRGSAVIVGSHPVTWVPIGTPSEKQSQKVASTVAVKWQGPDAGLHLIEPPQDDDCYGGWRPFNICLGDGSSKYAFGSDGPRGYRVVPSSNMTLLAVLIPGEVNVRSLHCGRAGTGSDVPEVEHVRKATTGRFSRLVLRDPIVMHSGECYGILVNGSGDFLYADIGNSTVSRSEITFTSTYKGSLQQNSYHLNLQLECHMGFRGREKS